ncbi:MAG TPA: 3-deoxy-D-manno-octulosonic acid transferase [Micropepsaceae bacterium]|nr:3-deoxy-D-manno-octulosonic acid transferase [Micropepsaceae bacterium]
MALALYRGVMRALSPSVLRRRARNGKEDPSRLSERKGVASRARPVGTLIWIHGASVGESLAILPLVAALLEKSGRNVLVTTGTVTSAKLMAERLPSCAFHQYVPIDAADCVRRFLDHWRPDLALFVDSELWPNLILETHARGIPMALVNARLSGRSFRGWNRAPQLARRIVSCFDACLAQDAEIANRLIALGARGVRIAGSLKADVPPLPVDAEALRAFMDAAGVRPIFLAASTHNGEEELVMRAAAELRKTRPDVLTVIVPRHPQRGPEIESSAKTHGFRVVRRAASALPGADTELYVADTLGELGLFYRAAPFAFLGKSLVIGGGQNPLEAAQLQRAILTGPYTENFAETFRVLLDAQGEGRVHSAEELAACTLDLIADPEKCARLAAGAKRAADSLGGALATTVKLTETLLAHHAAA